MSGNILNDYPVFSKEWSLIFPVNPITRLLLLYFFVESFSLFFLERKLLIFFEKNEPKLQSNFRVYSPLRILEAQLRRRLKK
jgi:hypothetical protein